MGRAEAIAANQRALTGFARLVGPATRGPTRRHGADLVQAPEERNRYRNRYVGIFDRLKGAVVEPLLGEEQRIEWPLGLLRWACCQCFTTS